VLLVLDILFNDRQWRAADCRHKIWAENNVVFAREKYVSVALEFTHATLYHLTLY